MDISDKSLIIRFCPQLRIIEIGHEEDDWVLGTEEKGFGYSLIPPVSEIDTNSHYILLKSKPIN